MERLAAKFLLMVLLEKYGEGTPVASGKFSRVLQQV
jgi:hypothetical protein